MRTRELYKLRPFVCCCQILSACLLALSGLVLLLHTHLLGGLGLWRHGHHWFSAMFLLSFLAQLALDWPRVKKNLAGSARTGQWLVALFLCLVFMVGVFLSSVDREEWRSTYPALPSVVQRD